MQSLIHFLIPLRPNTIPEQWLSICERMQDTLNSVIQQEEQNWRITIAGHEKPDFLSEINDSRIEFFEVDFDHSVSQEKPLRDKSWKVAFAAMKAEQHNPRFQMILDADDLLHKTFVSHIAKHSDSDAIVVRQGWEFDLNLKRALKRKHFDEICGSTIIYGTKKFPLPKSREWNEWNKLPHIHIGHDEAREDLKKRGFKTHYIETPCVAYVTGHGSNWSQHMREITLKRKLQFLIRGRSLNSKDHECFGLSI